MIDPTSIDTRVHWVPPHVRICVTATGTIVLDLKRTRYFGIGPDETRALSTLARNWSDASVVDGLALEPMPADHAAALALALIDAGLLVSTAPGRRPFVCRSLSSRASHGAGCELQRHSRVRAADLLAFSRAFFWARRGIAVGDLYALVCAVSRELRQKPGLADKQQAARMACTFRRLRPYSFRARDQCLLHALTLTRFLMLSNLQPTWVIAVRPRPWSAHSWVQLDDLVLDSDPEEIHGYTPILVI